MKQQRTTGRDEYSNADRAEMIRKMRDLSNAFYAGAVHVGVRAFIEWTGCMNEMIKVYAEALSRGIPFEHANTHTSTPLPFAAHHGAYLGEKLNCILGPSLAQNRAFREAFLFALLGGEGASPEEWRALANGKDGGR